jgi:hypothetical protein
MASEDGVDAVFDIERFELLGAAGIELAPLSVARSAEEASEAAKIFNRPVAMKIHEPAPPAQIRHWRSSASTFPPPKPQTVTTGSPRDLPRTASK